MKTYWKPLALLVVLLAVGGWLFWKFRPHSFVGTVIQSPEPAYNFELTSAEGPVRLSDFRGKWVLLFFGYTHCPDVCPTTLADLARVMELLGKDAEKLQVIMISVDPKRDTPERMAEYVRYFHPSFVGLTGTEDQIRDVATRYGIFYNYPEGTPDTGYIVEHTASTLLINPEGYLKVIFPPTFGPDGIAPEQMAADLKYLLGR